MHVADTRRLSSEFDETSAVDSATSTPKSTASDPIPREVVSACRATRELAFTAGQKPVMTWLSHPPTYALQHQHDYDFGFAAIVLAVGRLAPALLEEWKAHGTSLGIKRPASAPAVQNSRPALPTAAIVDAPPEGFDDLPAAPAIGIPPAPPLPLVDLHSSSSAPAEPRIPIGTSPDEIAAAQHAHVLTFYTEEQLAQGNAMFKYGSDSRKILQALIACRSKARREIAAWLATAVDLDVAFGLTLLPTKRFRTLRSCPVNSISRFL
ncbi:hypothetical protein B0A48_04186 [Cryoendolithus antarcticus]|uniref:Uncharacterized protein n=1 Tax=Cryoendolithus antarcticus TaxID=1507870 RepID=A0A1V8THN3_9PEZI|nr:hypothetical protein B0A48_04186 [Cryoendolithus antarcticus]